MEIADLVALRGAERLLIVAVAGLSIVLGFWLFKIVPTDTDSSGEFRALNMSIVVSKVGPGVFFAAFGALVLGTSVMTQLTVRPAPVPQQLARNDMPVPGQPQPEIAFDAPPVVQFAPQFQSSPQIAFQHSAPTPQLAPEPEPIPLTLNYASGEAKISASVEDVARTKDQIAFLNCAAMMAKEKLGAGISDSMQAAVDAANEALLASVWQQDWGEVGTLTSGKAKPEVETILAARSPACLADVLNVKAE